MRRVQKEAEREQERLADRVDAGELAPDPNEHSRVQSAIGKRARHHAVQELVRLKEIDPLVIGQARRRGG